MPSRSDVRSSAGVFSWFQPCVLVPCVRRAFAPRFPPLRVPSLPVLNGKLFWVLEDVLVSLNGHVYDTQHKFKEDMS